MEVITIIFWFVIFFGRCFFFCLALIVFVFLKHIFLFSEVSLRCLGFLRVRLVSCF